MTATEEMAHCSNHTYFSAGCGDCSTAELFQLTHGSKLNKKRYAIHHLTIDPGRPSPHIQLLRSQVHSVLKIFFANSKMKVIKAIKAEFAKLNKVDEDINQKDFVTAANDAVDWEIVIDDLALDLSQAYETAEKEGITQLAMKVDYSEVSSAALVYAKKRAAEMIGKRWVDGVLVDNPNAKFVIADTTRDDLKDLIERAFSKQTSFDEFEQAIELSGTFSDSRAALIAKTEIAMAHVQGNLAMWKQSGIVQTVGVVLSDNHTVTDECDAAATNGPYQISIVPMLPIHPGCLCGFVAVELKEP